MSFRPSTTRECMRLIIKHVGTSSIHLAFTVYLWAAVHLRSCSVNVRFENNTNRLRFFRSPRAGNQLHATCVVSSTWLLNAAYAFLCSDSVSTADVGGPKFSPGRDAQATHPREQDAS